MGVAQLKNSVLEIITETITFTASASESITIAADLHMREVVRGRLYINADPGAAFSAWATYSLYSKAAMHGADAFYRTATKLVYTELEVATTGTDANITPDDQTDFNPNDLALIIDAGNDEFIRLTTIANTMVAEDNIGVHAIDDGISRVSEFSGFSLFNNENGNNIYLKINFAVAQTVSLGLELLVRNTNG